MYIHVHQRPMFIATTYRPVNMFQPVSFDQLDVFAGQAKCQRGHIDPVYFCDGNKTIDIGVHD